MIKRRKQWIQGVMGDIKEQAQETGDHTDVVRDVQKKAEDTVDFNDVVKGRDI